MNQKNMSEEIKKEKEVATTQSKIITEEKKENTDISSKNEKVSVPVKFKDIIEKIENA